MRILSFFLIILLGFSALSAQNVSNTWIGVWEGQLKVSNNALRIVFNISQDASGALSATMDSPDQGAMGLAVKSVVVQDKQVTLELSVPVAKYEGILSEDKTELIGQWKQGGAALPLTLKHVEKASHLPRPQVEAIENDLHLPYANQEVSYINPKGNITLSGTFSKPNQGRKFPAVLLITGSGAQDRDETLFEHKPFLVLADYLARRGIAVLRVDDRGIGKSGGDLKGTTLDFADDVRAGIAYLKTRRDVNPRKIGLIGHSEGGLIAPIVASSSRDVAFIVLMAGTGVTGDQVILSQVIKPMEIQKMRPAVIEKAREQQSAVLQIAMNEANPDSAVVKMLKALYPNPERLPVSARQQIEAQLRPMLSPWYHTFLSLDPAPYLQKVKCPVLALNGDKDVQVIADLNLPKIESALKSGNNRRYLIKTLPNLNHLFQTATTGLTSEYGQITETLAPIALETIATWILEQVR